jgi:hypothetical protein
LLPPAGLVGLTFALLLLTFALLLLTFALLRIERLAPERLEPVVVGDDLARDVDEFFGLNLMGRGGHVRQQARRSS